MVVGPLVGVTRNCSVPPLVGVTCTQNTADGDVGWVMVPRVIVAVPALPKLPALIVAGSIASLNVTV